MPEAALESRIAVAKADQAGDASMRRLVEPMSRAPLVIVPMASKDVYLDRYALSDEGWSDRDKAR